MLKNRMLSIWTSERDSKGECNYSYKDDQSEMMKWTGYPTWQVEKSIQNFS
jgi:hypothetical protein